ncbi:MAG: hypothetical protein IKP60_09650, partial [Treponema sp.]|nr:hypothetical protein [Treponema sp.]
MKTRRASSQKLRRKNHAIQNKSLDRPENLSRSGHYENLVLGGFRCNRFDGNNLAVLAFTEDNLSFLDCIQ